MTIITPPLTSSTSFEEEESPPQQASSTAAAADPGAASLFNNSHVPRWTPSLLAYLPIGTAVAALRMCCWVLGVLIDAPWFRNQWVVDSYLSLLGFKANWKSLHNIPQGHHVMVSNHTTSADLQILFQLPCRYTHLITTAMPARVMSTQNLPTTLKAATPEVYEELAKLHAAQGEAAPPVHVFPEGGLTNGSGMMQFSRGFMKFVAPGTPIVPVALRARTPWGIRTHTLTSSFLANLFWLSFCPWVEVEAVALPVMQWEGPQVESRAAFVQRVQTAIASELGVDISSLTIQQKRRMMKQQEAGSHRRT